jgi:Cytochrome bd terminal oxidase subunit I
MNLDPLLLSRIQFGFTVSFHIIFPAFTIGLAAWLATMEGMRLVTGNPVYRRLFDFWIKIFAVSFGMGVVSGIVMHSSSAPTGACSPKKPARSKARCSVTRHSPRFCSRRPSSA